MMERSSSKGGVHILTHHPPSPQIGCSEIPATAPQTYLANG